MQLPERLTQESIRHFAEQIKDKKYVLIGEASHGTSEFYLWRAQLSRYLIENHGFSFVAVEGNWPECYEVNRYVKNYEGCAGSASEVLHSFAKWPTWMWANWETVAFVEWLRKFNDERKKRIGFYGLDVYSLWESLEEILQYLQNNDAEGYELAKKAFYCFESIGLDGQEYALGTRFTEKNCQEEVVELLTKLKEKPLIYNDEEESFNTLQNALVLKNAEHYYRTMVQSDAQSWNVRDNHMFETLQSLMKYHGKEAKGIVWEHNTHIGDARATNMTKQGMFNIGQLVREYDEAGAVLIGFGTYQGSVMAAQEWGAPMEVMEVPSAERDSWEAFLALDSAHEDTLISNLKHDPHYNQVRGHRAIGVVYDPRFERFGNYVPTNLGERYDAFIYIHETEALHPLHYDSGSVPAEYPWFF